MDSENPFPPGELLLKELEKQGMKQRELAIRTGVTEKHVSTVISGARPISANFARRLDIALGCKEGTWLACQTEYDEHQARLEEQKNVGPDEYAALAEMKEVVDFFIDAGMMQNHCGDTEKVIRVRKVLRVNELASIPRVASTGAYRAQINKRATLNQYVLFAWQRMCEIMTEDESLLKAPFSPNRLLERIDAIKELSFVPDLCEIEASLKKIFHDCGVVFRIVPHFTGAPVQGFIKQTNSGSTILCLTLRGKRADSFWFSLFHEIGHLVRGDFGLRYVDLEHLKTDAEGKADEFARDALIPPEPCRAFAQSGRYRDLDTIKAFARRIGVPHWIVIGRLQNDGLVSWSHWRHEIPSYDWAALAGATVTK